MSKLRTVLTESAGGVVYRQTDHRIEVALCGRIDPAIWTLPKGTPRHQESIEETAAREVSEETGLEVVNEGKIGSIEYWFIRGDLRFHKTVHHFLMRSVGGDISRHDHEYDLVQWFPLQQLLRVLTYPNEREIARQALDRLKGRDDVAPLVKENDSARSEGSAAPEAPGRREE